MNAPSDLEKLRVLFVEDSRSDAALIQRVLENNFNVQKLVRVERKDQFLKALPTDRWNLIISDYNLPGFSAFEALKIAKETKNPPPLILVSGAIGEEAVVEALKLGINDVVLKNNLPRLVYAIRRVLREVQATHNARLAKETAEAAVKAREQMLAIVSHDLRNPLAAIQLNAETIQNKLISMQSLNEAPAIATYAKSIIRSTWRMRSLISDILDKVRLAAGTFSLHKTRRSLQEFMAEVFDIFSPLAEEKLITLVLKTPEIDYILSLDFERLFQILSNLIGNAIKFTSSGGKVTVGVEVLDTEVRFVVSDTGKGMTADSVKKIFKRYWQQDKNSRLGVGLGLSIVQELVQSQQGKIWVESQIGAGSSFFFHLPCEVRRADEAPIVAGHFNKKIVLVDDDDDLREILEESLNARGFEVFAFSNAEETLRNLAEKEVRPDILILDFRLPDMSGGELATEIKKYLGLKDLPLIFLSAETHLSLLARQYRASTFMSKPLRLKDLYQTIENVFDQQNSLSH